MKNKINVNISPNPLDLQTLHCSQNDTSERKFYFTLHNNGEVIDTTDISDPIFEPFSVYKGGTEQLLPVNTDDPTTSPIIADIQYPDEEKTEQEFTYRESPTTIDGKALIEKIKGNTIVWNQMVQEVSSTYWEQVSNIASSSFANGECKFTASARYGYVALKSSAKFAIPTGHKALMLVDAKAPVGSKFIVGYGPSASFTATGIAKNNVGGTGSYETISILGTWSGTYNKYSALVMDNSTSNWSEIAFKNVMLFDLTAMFGSGNEPSTVEEFTSLFPLPYYQYEQGKLLSFNGEGIKTVGFNQWDEEWEVGAVNSADGSNESASDRIRSKGYIKCLPNTEYFYVAGNANLRIIFYDANKSYISYFNYSGVTHLFTTPSDCCYMRFNSNGAYGNTYNNDICINISSSEDGKYEPYQSSTSSLPISGYFPTGMKSAGSVYDELTSSKAITRLIETIVDGTNIEASYYGSFEGHQLFYIDVFAQTYVAYSNMTNLKSNHYLTAINAVMNDRYIRYQASNNQANIGRIYWNDDRYTSADEMNTALQSSPLEIVSMAQSETVETFSFASLVTENTEIPLSNEDGVLVGKCNSDVSADAGFIEGKIKLSDEDGDVYSNKIQIHVERKP